MLDKFSVFNKLHCMVFKAHNITENIPTVSFKSAGQYTCFQPLILSCSLYATDSSYTHPIYTCVMPHFPCLST
jgi:hypothetical protein